MVGGALRGGGQGGWLPQGAACEGALSSGMHGKQAHCSYTASAYAVELCMDDGVLDLA